ncbi:uncharacterized protein RSE6_02711 [Rhynchosporium secalis]|uniref:Uncharacterized protein n=1 Tax=Rhynchosporium secalis TaxID=38038 RepID=A0A1E1M0X0_RHYSE|nr:uncharacterized protein RSE6_02711 [Rhynchosporium secalis]
MKKNQKDFKSCCSHLEPKPSCQCGGVNPTVKVTLSGGIVQSESPVIYREMNQR